MTQTIYVVTSGEYSDYQIRAIFDNRDMADAMATQANAVRHSDDHRVEIFTLNPGAANYHEGRALWTVAMRKDGSIVEDLTGGAFWKTQDEADVSRWSYESEYIKPSISSLDLPRYRVTAFYVTESIWARDRQHAIKICNERRAQHIASGRWDEEEQRIRRMMSEGDYYPSYYRMDV